MESPGRYGCYPILQNDLGNVVAAAFPRVGCHLRKVAAATDQQVDDRYSILIDAALHHVPGKASCQFSFQISVSDHCITIPVHTTKDQLPVVFRRLPGVAGLWDHLFIGCITACIAAPVRCGTRLRTGGFCGDRLHVVMDRPRFEPRKIRNSPAVQFVPAGISRICA